MFKYKSFEEKLPQVEASVVYSPFSILHNSDGSSCIIGFRQRIAKLENKHTLQKLRLIGGKEGVLFEKRKSARLFCAHDFDFAHDFPVLYFCTGD